MALPQKTGAQRLKEYLDLSLFLFKRTPLLKQEALKDHFQRYHKVPRHDWLRDLAYMIGSSNLRALNALAQGGGEAPAAALGSLPAPYQQDSSQTSGVSAALSDLLHMGMTAMQARAQQRCIPALSDGPDQACTKTAEPPAPEASAADAAALPATPGNALQQRIGMLPSAQQQIHRRRPNPPRGIHKRYRRWRSLLIRRSLQGHFASTFPSSARTLPVPEQVSSLCDWQTDLQL